MTNKRESLNGISGEICVDAGPDYFDRNKRWMMPLVAAALILGSNLVFTVLGESFIPRSVVELGVGIALMLTGFGAMMTRTLSARILMILAFAGAGVVLLTYISAVLSQ